MNIPATMPDEAGAVTIPILALVLSGVIMGFSPAFVRFAEVGPFASAFWRVFFALPPLALWAMIEHRKGCSTRLATPDASAFFAGLMFAGDLIFWHLAILHTTIANAVFLVAFAPVWVALFSNLFLGERSGWLSMIGLFFCICGLGLLMASTFQYHPDRLFGDACGLVASFFLGFYFLAMRTARRRSAGGGLFLVTTSTTTVALLAVALLSGDILFPDSSSGWVSLISLGVFTHAGGQGLVTFALGTLSAVFSSLVIYVEALAAVLFSWLLLEEKISTIQIAGGVMILLGMSLTRTTGSVSTGRVTNS